MGRIRHWSLGAKLALVGTPFLLLGLCLIGLTLWISWQLDGGAAAVNEAGRMRMQTYRLALSATTGDADALARQVRNFEESLALLRRGDVERPLVVPWDSALEAQFARVNRGWKEFRSRAERVVAGREPEESMAGVAAGFVAEIDTLVTGIERHLARWTTTLHLLQVGMMILAAIASAILLYAGYMFVLEPVGRLKFATERIQAGDLGARVGVVTSDEFGALAACFNDMAGHLEMMHRDLETRVIQKTAELAEKTERLQALYDITTLTATATSLQALGDGFAERIARALRADGVAVRWTDAGNKRFMLLAAHGLSQAMVDGSRCLQAGACHCGATPALKGVRVVGADTLATVEMPHCRDAGFRSLVSIPVRLHERLMGEVDLFYHAEVTPTPAETSLLDALAAHLAAAMENLRLDALAKENAIAQERLFLANELHDSIAQSLAFLKIQVQLMREALDERDAARAEAVLDEIDAGVRESYGDVRELLVHFRTRARDEDIGAALATTLSKFEQQSGLKVTFDRQGNGMPLSADVQIQVLHIVQEALSNVRKHAGASRVWVTMREAPCWSFEVRDDGVGFDSGGAQDETHVGLRIMAERAAKIGARLGVASKPGGGTTVSLELPAAGAAGEGSVERAVSASAADAAVPH
jgi:two-component system nitrate/nitrite sensor histidine kinase NarX